MATEKTNQITIRLNKLDSEFLNSVLEKTGIKKSDVISRALALYRNSDSNPLKEVESEKE